MALEVYRVWVLLLPARCLLPPLELVAAEPAARVVLLVWAVVPVLVAVVVPVPVVLRLAEQFAEVRWDAVSAPLLLAVGIEEEIWDFFRL